VVVFSIVVVVGEEGIMKELKPEGSTIMREDISGTQNGSLMSFLVLTSVF